MPWKWVPIVRPKIPHVPKNIADDLPNSPKVLEIVEKKASSVRCWELEFPNPKMHYITSFSFNNTTSKPNPKSHYGLDGRN
jgi:hypothetical protein